MNNELTVQERGLKITGDPMHLKMIADAIELYAETWTYAYEDEILNGLSEKLSQSYRRFYGLDHWEFTESHNLEFLRRNDWE